MTKRPNYVLDDELYHYNIPGSHWGIRRWQNEDGSWTPAGRERYGKESAKASYNLQKYKADLKSKAQKESDKRYAKEERNRIKQLAKTEKLRRREEEKLNEQVNKTTKSKRMSDEELRSKIDRLNMEIEYQKKKAIVDNSGSVLARANAWFETPVGRQVLQTSAQTIGIITQNAAQQLVSNALKYANPRDRKYMDESIKQQQNLTYLSDLEKGAAARAFLQGNNNIATNHNQNQNQNQNQNSGGKKKKKK